jgi:hypothetical protein
VFFFQVQGKRQTFHLPENTEPQRDLKMREASKQSATQDPGRRNLPEA